MRKLTYCQALNEALHQIMENDESVILIGQGVWSPWYVGSTCKGLLDRFGKDRIIDTPVSENGVTGMAVGMAISGMRPILVFPRMDFLMYAMDPIVNQASKWQFMSGGRSKVPIVFWSIINRGNGQAAQHSQDLRWMFRGIPGLKCYEAFAHQDVGRCLKEAVYDDNPCMFFDNREYYNGVKETEMFNIHIPVGTPMPASEALEKKWFERYGR